MEGRTRSRLSRVASRLSWTVEGQLHGEGVRHAGWMSLHMHVHSLPRRLGDASDDSGTALLSRLPACAPAPPQVQILVRKVRNKAAGTIGDCVLEYERINGR